MSYDPSIINMQDIRLPELRYNYTMVDGSFENPVYNLPDGETPDTYVRPPRLTEEEINNLYIPPAPLSLTRQYTFVGGTMEDPIYNVPPGETPDTYVRPPPISREEFLNIVQERVYFLTDNGDWKDWDYLNTLAELMAASAQ